MTCPAACNIGARLSLKGKKLGSAKKALLAAGTAKLKIKLSKAAKRKLRRARKPKLTLKVTVIDAAGNVHGADEDDQDQALAARASSARSSAATSSAASCPARKRSAARRPPSSRRPRSPCSAR